MPPPLPYVRSGKTGKEEDIDLGLSDLFGKARNCSSSLMSVCLVYMYVRAFACVCVCTCLHAWRPEVDAKEFSLITFYLIL